VRDRQEIVRILGSPTGHQPSSEARSQTGTTMYHLSERRSRDSQCGTVQPPAWDHPDIREAVVRQTATAQKLHRWCIDQPSWLNQSRAKIRRPRTLRMVVQAPNAPGDHSHDELRRTCRRRAGALGAGREPSLSRRLLHSSDWSHHQVRGGRRRSHRGGRDVTGVRLVVRGASERISLGQRLAPPRPSAIPSEEGIQDP
jgi:hypothetical protein